MNSYRKWLLPFLILVLAFGTFGSSSAQEEFCLGLNEADCELYYELSANPALPTSTAFESTVSGNVTVPQEAPINFTVGLSGAYVIDEAQAQEATDTFGALSVLDVSLRDTLDLAEGTTAAFDAELAIDLNGIEQLAMMTGGAELPPVSLWLMDGVAYADLTLVSNFLGDPTLAGVFGINAFDAIELLLENVTVASLIPDTSGMGMGGDMGDFGMMQDPNNPFNQFAENFQNGFQAGLQITEADVESFASVERLADETMDGMELVVYQTDIDIPAIFSVDPIREQVITGLEQAELPDDIDPDAFIDALATAMAGSEVTVIEKYDTASGFLVSTTTTSNVTFDIAPILEVLGEEMMGAEDQTVTASFTIDFTRSDINAVDAITLPEGAEEVPVSALLGGF